MTCLVGAAPIGAATSKASSSSQLNPGWRRACRRDLPSESTCHIASRFAFPSAAPIGAAPGLAHHQHLSGGVGGRACRRDTRRRFIAGVGRVRVHRALGCSSWASGCGRACRRGSRTLASHGRVAYGGHAHSFMVGRWGPHGRTLISRACRRGIVVFVRIGCSGCNGRGRACRRGTRVARIGLGPRVAAVPTAVEVVDEVNRGPPVLARLRAAPPRGAQFAECRSRSAAWYRLETHVARGARTRWVVGAGARRHGAREGQHTWWRIRYQPPSHVAIRAQILPIDFLICHVCGGGGHTSTHLPRVALAAGRFV